MEAAMRLLCSLDEVTLFGSKAEAPESDIDQLIFTEKPRQPIGGTMARSLGSTFFLEFIERSRTTARRHQPVPLRDADLSRAGFGVPDPRRSGHLTPEPFELCGPGPKMCV